MTELKCLTPLNGKHHLFGFHDLIATNNSNNKLLSLEVDTINRPPIPFEKVGVGYVNMENGNYLRIGETNAFNFPQGARMQWVDDKKFIVNNQVENKWGCIVYDTDLGEKIDQFESTCHCLSNDSRYAYGINYARLHRLGGYGYIGLADTTSNEIKPNNDGIFETDLETKKIKLLVSINEVANFDIETSGDNGFHHYLTHLLLSPNGKRIAFLHRFFYSDGGLRTRLLTINVDGSNLRCIASGFLSHFEWKDDISLFIWGRTNSAIDAIRTNPIFSIPIVAPFLGIAKVVVRKLLKKTNQLSGSFILINDTDKKNSIPFAQGIITKDGHPMCCPLDRNIVLCDTYPDEFKVRDLFLYNINQNTRQDLGHFRMMDDLPDMTKIKEYTLGVDEKVLSLINLDSFIHSKSGLHCDLHPRWSSDGKIAIFDSIHEGSRQIYGIEMSNYFK